MAQEEHPHQPAQKQERQPGIEGEMTPRPQAEDRTYRGSDMKEGAAIVNTTSVTAYKGNPQLIDYSSTKGAIVAFTRSLSQSLVEKGIRVNAVAPGPIWTPLIPATFPPDKVAKFGSDVPMKRPGQPVEVATCYVFLASDDASYLTGQVLHPNGGTVVNG
jgi:NAD(P)-dependent dehydrogenase (short-subunit alcohol dehydrogenase family)